MDFNASNGLGFPVPFGHEQEPVFRFDAALRTQPLAVLLAEHAKRQLQRQRVADGVRQVNGRSLKDVLIRVFGIGLAGELGVELRGNRESEPLPDTGNSA